VSIRQHSHRIPLPRRCTTILTGTSRVPPISVPMKLDSPGIGTHYKLCSLGIKSIVVNPADIPTTSKEKVQKGDARDSQKIARSLKNGELVPIYIPSLSSLGDRGLLRLRKTVVNDTTGIKNRIKASLHFNGISIPA